MPASARRSSLEQVGVVHVGLDALERGEDFDQAGVVVEEGGGDGAAAQFLEFLEFGVGLGRAHVLGDVEPGERADAVHAVREAQRHVVGRLEVGDWLGRLRR